MGGKSWGGVRGVPSRDTQPFPRMAKAGDRKWQNARRAIHFPSPECSAGLRPTCNERVDFRGPALRQAAAHARHSLAQWRLKANAPAASPQSAAVSAAVSAHSGGAPAGVQLQYGVHDQTRPRQSSRARAPRTTYCERPVFLQGVAILGRRRSARPSRATTSAGSA